MSRLLGSKSIVLLNMTQFQTNIINIHGERGKEWLMSLPVIIASVASKYQLFELSLLDNLSYNYVLAGLRCDQPIMLKLSPDISGLKREAEVLRCFDGNGAVKVIAEEEGVLILERAMPGISLKSYFPDIDDEAIEIACQVMKRLHGRSSLQGALITQQSNNIELLTGSSQLVLCDDKSNNNFLLHLKKAQGLLDDLLKTSAPSILLHGDLHHDNILKHGDEWRVIDPKGILAEPAYEVAAFIRNPILDLLQHKRSIAIIRNRISIFADKLDLPEDRIKSWCYVQAVQAWVWVLEDSGDTSYFKQLAEIFEEIVDL